MKSDLQCTLCFESLILNHNFLPVFGIRNKKEKNLFPAVLRILDVYPGSGFFSCSIHDPTKTRGGEK
jgi:hypothetical protein